MRISDWSSDVCSSDLAIGEGEAAGLCDQVNCPRVDVLRRGGFQRGEVEGFQQLQNLQDGDAARSRRRHAADDPGTVRQAERLAALGLIAAPVEVAEQAGEIGRADVWTPVTNANLGCRRR